MSRAYVLAALAMALVVAVPAQARQTGPEREAEAFRQRLLAALARDDRAAVAGMIQYRLIVEAGFLIPVVDGDELPDRGQRISAARHAGAEVRDASRLRWCRARGWPHSRGATSRWTQDCPHHRSRGVRRGDGGTTASRPLQVGQGARLIRGPAECRQRRRLRGEGEQG